MKSIVALLLPVVALLAVPAHAQEDQLPSAPAGQTWKLVWQDEFDGDKLDATKWTPRPDGKRKGGWWSKEAVGLDGKGNLVIETYMDGDKPTDGCITISVDMTQAMLDKAQRNAAAVGVSNIEWRLADAESLPVTDGTVDVVITNGVLNLCQDKSRVLTELHRVLCPGGRLQLADILLHEDVTAENVAKLGNWSD